MGTAQVVKHIQRSQLLGLCVIVLHQLVLGPGSFVHAQLLKYYDVELQGLQALWGAWNTSTPDLSSNLAGWNSIQTQPCQYLHENFNYTNGSDWRGVQCMFWCNDNDTDCSSVWNIQVAVISLSNASIEGILPPEIGNFTYMTNLELTGNPKLTGSLPDTLQYTWLNVLDVHDNGFSGPIPDLTFLWNLLQLDLSGNQFTGEYPFYQLRMMNALQELSIGDNRLAGEIQADAYTNKTELEKLDISDNFFTGALPVLDPLHKLIHLDVSGNQFEGQLPDLRKFSTLRYVNLGGNKFTGTANLLEIFNLNASTSLTVVDLSSNQLTGPLPSWNASNIGSIQELHLDNNTLSGTLDISQMHALGLLLDKNSVADNSTKKLEILSLSNNSITHVISDSHVIANIATIFRLENNPYCDNYDSNDDGHRCYCDQICFVTPAKPDSRRIVVAATTSSMVAVVVILLVVVGAILTKNKRYKRYLQLQFEQKFEEFDVKPTIFPYSELRAATRDFHEDMKLGQGGYGAVYKGVLPNGNEVAVKQLYNSRIAPGLDEFLNEVVLITGMKHRNLVNLKGCCLREDQRLLVYEYVDNSDVDQILLGPRREMVSWLVRLKICLGIAHGLHYLHALAHPRVIHRDIKARNVLLDKNLDPKIADFGLALLFPDEESHIMTIHVAGTKGYLAPEYASLGQLSDKVDVYSFGVLCLEIISGRRNIDETVPLDQVYLSKWAWRLHEEDRLSELVDPTLHLTDEEVRDVQRVINVCLLCTQNAVERRPSMARVVSMLQSDSESEVQVLNERKSSMRSYQSTRSLRSGDFMNLKSVSEEPDSTSNGAQCRDLDSFDVELGVIRAR